MLSAVCDSWKGVGDKGSTCRGTVELEHQKCNDLQTFYHDNAIACMYVINQSQAAY